MIEYLKDYRVKLLIDGEKQSIIVLARNEHDAKLDGFDKAKKLLQPRTIEIVSVEVVEYKPYA
jgi:hypothetical protein